MTMRQLALDIRLADHAVFESFFAGPNALPVASLQRLAAADGLQIVWIWGPRDIGKSHLLQASVALAHHHDAATAYLPLAELRRLSPAVLDGMGSLDLVALDDADAVAGDAAWEQGLFRLYEAVIARGGRLVMAGASPPTQSGFALADLASRFAAGAVFRLERLSDADCVSALQQRAEWRGFSLPEETGRFLLTRVERGTGSLFQLLDRLDRAALAAQKRLTVPFVRSVLGSDA
jgi:DnaA family protein